MFGVLCKLDLEKAYDHVNWNFLFYLLKRCEFLKKWRHWISFYISSTRFSVLVNSNPCGFFSSSKELRQGDPLSPLLFITTMEALSRLLDVATSAGLELGFSIDCLNREPLVFSHLLFADDTFIFCEAGPLHLFHLCALLVWFEAASGLCINLSKSRLTPIGVVHGVEILWYQVS